MLEKTLESPLGCKEIQPVHPKGDQSWVFIGRTAVEAEAPVLWPADAELTHLKRPWCWERLRAGEEEDDRGCYGWMASPTRWTWVLTSSWCWRWTGKPGVLQSMGSHRVGHDWATELKILTHPGQEFFVFRCQYKPSKKWHFAFPCHFLYFSWEWWRSK